MGRSKPLAMSVNDVLGSFGELGRFLGKRRLTPTVIPAGKDYADGFADGLAFAINTVSSMQRQLMAKVAANHKEQQNRQNGHAAEADDGE